MANEQDSNKQLNWNNPQNGQQKQHEKPQSGAPQHQHQQPAQQKAPVEQRPAVSAVPAVALGTDGTRSAARVVAWLAVGVVAGVIIAWGATGALNKKGSGTTAGSLQSATSTGASQANATSSLLTVASPQKAGTQVAVSGVTVSTPVWVVVYESREGKPGNVLGASLFFPGTPSGTVELLRGTIAGQSYFVTERKDNGDRKFSLTADSLVLGTDGQPMWATFTAN